MNANFILEYLFLREKKLKYLLPASVVPETNWDTFLCSFLIYEDVFLCDWWNYGRGVVLSSSENTCHQSK